MNILMVGGGFMGSALLGCWTDHDIITIDPEPRILDARCLKNIGELPIDYAPDIIVLAVKPQVMEQVLVPYVEKFGARPIWVSVAAGLPLSFYKKFNPNLRFVRCMPNMPVLYQQGSIGLFSECKAMVESVVNALFKASGQVVWLDDESQMDAVTAISGSGPAYFYLMVEMLTNAGIKQGLSLEQAALLARQTLIGAGEVMKQATNTEAKTLRTQVTSPGGTTAAALAVMMENDRFQDVITDAVKAACDRSIELGKHY
ncbi:MAG: pyrroline-5-carboxylate reductase [Candidatus Paracaedibacteraceae bacterium]|nr:pyrroline-5-carboxylate reductase [Candidatus Paracaedibacteraceae bacterium]